MIHAHYAFAGMPGEADWNMICYTRRRVAKENLRNEKETMKNLIDVCLFVCETVSRPKVVTDVSISFYSETVAFSTLVIDDPSGFKVISVEPLAGTLSTISWVGE